jgi:hypothetical protein
LQTIVEIIPAPNAGTISFIIIFNTIFF